jgi:hypothetical protein
MQLVYGLVLQRRDIMCAGVEVRPHCVPNPRRRRKESNDVTRLSYNSV